ESCLRPARPRASQSRLLGFGTHLNQTHLFPKTVPGGWPSVPAGIGSELPAAVLPPHILRLRSQSRLHKPFRQLRSEFSRLNSLTEHVMARADGTLCGHNSRPRCVRLCDACTTTRPCCAHWLAAFGVCSNFAERIRTFLPNKSVTALRIAANVSGEISSGAWSPRNAALLR